MAQRYTLGLFANMYPAFEGDYRGIFIGQMVRDLELRGITVKKAVKTSSSVAGYIPFFRQSLSLARDKDLTSSRLNTSHTAVLFLHCSNGRTVPLC